MANSSLEVVLTFRDGKEEFSKTYSFNDIRALIEKNQNPFASELGCLLCCSKKAGTAACIARCLVDGKCCDGGATNCEDAKK